MKMRYKISNQDFFYTLLSFFLVSSISVGRLFDPRLEIGWLNISWILTFTVLAGSLLALVNYRYFKSNIYFYLLTIFWILISISTIVAELFFYYSPEVSAIAFTKMFNFLIFVLFPAFLIFLINDPSFIKRIYYAIFLVALLLGIAGIIKLFAIGFHFSNVKRLAILGGPIVFSRWMLTGALFVVTIKPFSKLLNILLIILFLVCSIFSASKGPLLAFLICLTIGYLKRQRISIERLLLSHKLYMVIFAAFLIIIPLFTTLMPGRLKDLTELNIRSTSAQGRIARYIPTMKIIEDHPLGVGSNRWTIFFNEITGRKLPLGQYPHNIFLEILSEFGWIAGLLVLIIIIISFHKFSDMIQWNGETNTINIDLFIYLFTFFFLINSLISGSLNDTRFLFLGLTSLNCLKLNIHRN